jgi:glycosyltransferase involved in cell wall biosynthesis
VCLIVPDGTWDVAALADAVRTHHPDWSLGAVWCGDPQLRPRLDTVAWIDRQLPEETGVGWSRLVVAMASRPYEWMRTAAALERWFADGADAPEAVVALRVGSVAIETGLAGLVPTSGVRLARRTSELPPSDGLGPTSTDLAAAGVWSTAAVGLHRDAAAGLSAFGRALLGARTDDTLAALLGVFAVGAGSTEADPSAVHCLGWGPPPSDPVGVIDAEALDRDQPWRTRISAAPSRIRLSQHPQFTERLDRVRPQLTGRLRPLVLPGGLRVDASIRSLLAHAIDAWQRGDGDLPPAPYGPDSGAFLRWLETPSPSWGAPVGRYWRDLRTRRADLSAAFPRVDSSDQLRYREWIDTTWRIDGRSPLLRAAVPGGERPAIDDTARNRNGVNVVGYLTFDSSLGDVARRIVSSLEAARVPVASIGYDRTDSPTTTLEVAVSPRAPFATNLVVVNADQFDFLVADHGDTLLRGRHTIAYWFWELETIPPHMVSAIDHVDEIWAGSRFVAEAFARVTDKPVRLMPIPVAEPQPSARTREELGLPDQAFAFLVTFDHFSVVERKNPFGAIEAFCRAFPQPHPGGPVLVVKSINGGRRWDSHERLLLATAHRDDIVVIDAHLDRADQMALLRSCDCLVSLHRSEGLGLHCAEAMWLGRPVVATRYSGNLDFMDDDCAALIDAELVPVEHGEGVYASSARWADPDLDQAAAWMRRLVDEPALAAHLGAAGRAKMERQPTAADTGRRIARLAALGAYQPGGEAMVVVPHDPHHDVTDRETRT